MEAREVRSQQAGLMSTNPGSGRNKETFTSVKRRNAWSNNVNESSLPQTNDRRWRQALRFGQVSSGQHLTPHHGRLGSVAQLMNATLHELVLHHHHLSLPLPDGSEAAISRLQSGRLSMSDPEVHELRGRMRLILICVKVQRRLRERALTYELIGARLACLKSGEPAMHGCLCFPKSGRQPVPIPFMTVSDTTTPSLLAELLDRSWKLPKPEILLSVTGGVQDFSLPPSLTSILQEGLVAAVLSTRACVFSGGECSGGKCSGGK